MLKKININHLKRTLQQEALKEVQILKSLKHPHVIRYFHSFIEDEFLYILMEYADNGDLYRLMKNRREIKRNFKEDEIWSIAYEILMAIDYIHKRNIVHRDIKSLNVFIHDNSIKIGDLGVS